jgi:predicted nucleotidyltransferase
MTHLEDLLRRLAPFLDGRAQPWALLGGLAVSVRTEPRFTRDLDLALAVDDDKRAEALVFDLQGAGFRALATVEQEETHRLATARLAPSGDPPEGLMLDLLFASSGIEAEVCTEAERLQVFPGCSVPVARLHHLIALKLLARDDRTRPQDAGDLRQLLAEAEPSDIEGARTAVQMIEARGFNRGRDLRKALVSAMQEFGWSKNPPRA